MNKNYHQILNVKRGWTKIPNAIRHDKNLTSDAKVVIEELLSVTGDFHISESGLAGSLNISLERVKKAIRLLKSEGYIQLKRIKKGTQFIGCEWQISDTAGTFQKLNSHQTENPSNGNPSDGNPSEWKSGRMETQSNGNTPIYQITEGYEVINTTNNQKPMDEHTEKNQLLHHQAQALEEVDEGFSGVSSSGSFSSESSSEANASPLQGKKPGQGEQVISQTEYLYQQLRNKYPPHRLGDYADGFKAFQSIPGIATVYPEIVRGLESWKQSESWSNEDGRYVPGLVKFLNERKWKIPPTWSNSASGTNNYANSDARKAVAEKWHQLETQSYITDSIGD